MKNYADEIKNLVPMIDVARMYGFEPDRSGNICCPFHNDKRPSLHIYDGIRGWHCFTCNEGGDPVDFVKKLFGLSFRDACKKLNSDFGLGLSIDDKPDANKKPEIDPEAVERMKRKAEHDDKHLILLAAYNVALDRWIYLDKMKRENAPSSPEEEPNDKFVYALHRLSMASYLLDCAASRLYEFEHSA